MTGTILLAEEGVNGTIAGPPDGVAAVLTRLRALPGCAALEHKESYTEENPFYRAKVRLKKEIVTMGAPEANPAKEVGTYVPPEEWNALISDPDMVVIDTRNDYEVGIGTFEGAVNPHTKSFREFPEWFDNFRKERPNAKYAMFCTGGIRCEKATSYLKHEGVEEVYHLQGGILKYLENIPSAKSLWRGECFVFDNRVSVDHNLARGSYEMCHACRRPLDEEAMASPSYKEGVSCPHCIDEHDDARREDFAERQKTNHAGQGAGRGAYRRAPPAKGARLARMATPVLYSFRRCPYAMRARMAIAVSRTPVFLREIILRDKPEEMLAASPKGTVPVLVLEDGTVIDESLDVMDWALERADPEEWRASGKGDTAAMRVLIAENDGPFKHHLDRYKYAARYENADAEFHRAEGEKFLRSLNERLQKADYLFGANRSLADAAIFPFIRQFRIADEAWFDSQDFDALHQWLQRHLDWPLFMSVMKKYPLWKDKGESIPFP